MSRTEDTEYYNRWDPACYCATLDIGVSQGPFLGPLLLFVYTQPLGITSFHAKTVQPHSSYAHGHRINKHFRMTDTISYNQAQHDLEVCVEDVRAWTLTNRLMFNNDKAEYMVFTTQYYNAACQRTQPLCRKGDGFCVTHPQDSGCHHGQHDEHGRAHQECQMCNVFPSAFHQEA